MVLPNPKTPPPGSTSGVTKLLLSIYLLQMHAGPPSTPADLAATENGVGSLNISWSLVTIEGVAVTFTVTVMNLNDSSTGPMEVSGIQDQHYIFTLEDSTSCDVYSFQVTAVNGAGTGTPSEIITRSLPSLPDISPVQDSLQHSLVRTASGVTLSVTFNVRVHDHAYNELAVNFHVPRRISYLVWTIHLTTTLWWW